MSLAVISVGYACSGDQRSGAVPADTSRATSDTASGATIDTTRTTPDTAPATARVDSARRDTAPGVAARPSAPKPRSPKPAPAARAPRADTTAAAAARKPAPQPANTETTATAAAQPKDTAATTPTQTSQANAPLRDQYHRAPLDTVSQQVYDGWKQFNLNCARCHGEDAQGTTIAPHLIVSLKPDGPINTKEMFVKTVCAGRPEKGMPAWCALGMEMPTIEAIYAYVKGRSDAKIHPGRPAVKSGG